MRSSWVITVASIPFLLRATSSLIFLFLTVFTIPLTFDVGGKDCGLAFSLSLATYYFFYSILRLATPDGSRVRFALVQLVKYTQWVTILGLMIWSMNKFAVDSSSNAAASWVERTFRSKGGPTSASGLKLWLLGSGGVVESVALNGWEKGLMWSTPVFQLLEGFCSLLVLQACGQMTRWLVNRERGDSWTIGLLGLSSAILSSSLYFLYRITSFPDLTPTDALLIGATITCVIILGSWGISTGRGNPIESSLLFAYVTLCIYQIFTDYQPSGGKEKAEVIPPVQPEYPPLPPVIMATYSTLLHYAASLPTAAHASFNFVWAVVMTITPSVIISLAYRVFVMYAAARIIPAIRQSGVRVLNEEPTLDDDDDAGRFLGFLTWFSPSILIAVYTSLLMQHFSNVNGNGNKVGEWLVGGGGDAGGNVFRWVNIIFVQVIYAVELYMSREDVIVPHWKVD